MPDPRDNFLASRWFSFKAALAGIAYMLRTQPNAWIELTAAAVAVIAGLTIGLQRLEWALLGTVICLVLALEAINTAIETVVDLVSPEPHPLAKIAKDTAAGALIFAVLGSLIVAAAIFGPRILAVFG